MSTWQTMGGLELTEAQTATEAMLREGGPDGRSVLARVVQDVLTQHTDLGPARRHTLSYLVIDALAPSIMEAAQAAVIASRLAPPSDTNAPKETR
jgi:hypothetical protein